MVAVCGCGGLSGGILVCQLSIQYLLGSENVCVFHSFIHSFGSCSLLRPLGEVFR